MTIEPQSYSSDLHEHFDMLPRVTVDSTPTANIAAATSISRSLLTPSSTQVSGSSLKP